MFMEWEKAVDDVYVPARGSISVTAKPDKFKLHHGSVSSFSKTLQSSIQLSDTQREQLSKQGFTRGMQNNLAESVLSFPLRIWVVDNSGSMQIPDGHRLFGSLTDTNEMKSVTCTRWKELQHTIQYHIQLSALLKAPSTFRFLNKPGRGLPKEFTIADGGEEVTQKELDYATSVVKLAAPIGVTPLTQHVKEIKEQVQALAPALSDDGRRVSIILATDGLPSNERGHSGEKELDEFTEAVKSLEGLPVWIVIRLCTDDAETVNFYNSLDAKLELSIEVLDNFENEAKEIYKKNAWINYCLPIHRMREIGYHHRILDMLDERKLTISEVKDYCKILFGPTKMKDLPRPELDLCMFLGGLKTIISEQEEQWNMMKQKMKPLISISKVKKIHGARRVF